jgi:hypothetical protein
MRTTCRHYHASNRAYPSERLCSPHLHDAWQPILVTPQQIAEHHALALINGTAQELHA